MLWLLLPYMAGLVVGQQLRDVLSIGLTLATAALAATVALLGRRHVWVWSVAFCASVLLSGTVYYQLRRARVALWDHLPPREVRLTLAITRVFASADARMLSGLARVVVAD